MNLREEIKLILERARLPLTEENIFGRITSHRGKTRLNANTKKRIRLILTKNSLKPKGSIIKNDIGYHSRKKIEKALKNKIISEIKKQGFTITSDNTIRQPDMGSKSSIRDYHRLACIDKFEKSLTFIRQNEEQLIQYFAEGDEIDIESFRAKIQVVKHESVENNLFRYATLLWSVPVSQGFGRRIRFLVWDENNGKLIGIFAIGDPVLNLTCREQFIGWNREEKMSRLYNVMDIFILGAVPPYNILLGGKLVALLASSNEVRNYVKKRYSNKRTIINKEIKNPRLALLTTGSALGKSSIYDRINYDNRKIYQKIGESEGWGHFHLNHGLFEDMRKYLEWTKPNKANAHRFGQGPNWKIRTAKETLRCLGLPTNLLRHGIRREIYAIPLAKNYREFLKGENKRLYYYDMPVEQLSKYWKQRWLVGRTERRPDYLDIKRKDVQQTIHQWGKKKGKT